MAPDRPCTVTTKAMLGTDAQLDLISTIVTEICFATCLRYWCFEKT
jgi:hypothetical protein